MLSYSSETKYALTARLVNRDQLWATLELENNHGAMMKNIIYWPIDRLPHESEIGETLILEVRTAEKQQEEKYARMRRLLEELIN